MHPTSPLGCLPGWPPCWRHGSCLCPKQGTTQPRGFFSSAFLCCWVVHPSESAMFVVWDVSQSPQHLLLCKGRLNREVPQHPVCAPLGNRRSRKALYRHREKQTTFYPAAFQFSDIHQLSLQRKGSDFFSPLGMKVLSSGEQNTIPAPIV